MDKYEDATLRKVLAVTLDPADAQPQATPPVIYLGQAGTGERRFLPCTHNPQQAQQHPQQAQLAQELQDESGTSDTPLLSGNNLERVLMARLSDPPSAYPQWPVHYLIGCYARAAEELRSVSHLKSPGDQARLAEALGLARQLAVSYVGLTLYMDMFPQASGTAGLAGAMSRVPRAAAAVPAGSTSSGGGGGGGLPGGAVPAPPGFLEDFGARFEEEGLQEVVEAMATTDPVAAEHLTQCLYRCMAFPDLYFIAHRESLPSDLSPSWPASRGCPRWPTLGPPLALLDRLARCKPFARGSDPLPPLAAGAAGGGESSCSREVQALCTGSDPLPRWLPAQQESGRTLEFNSILGPAFGISALPDPTQYLPLRQPDDTRDTMVNWLAGALQSRRSDTRDAMLNWLAGALQSNAEREKMQPDPRRMANDGFMLNLAGMQPDPHRLAIDGVMLNLAGVMLLLCEPFVDPIAGKAWPRLDARYVSDPSSRDPHRPEELTRLAADSDAVRRWAGWGAEGANGAAGAGGSGAPTTSSEMHHKLVRSVPHYTEQLQQLEAELSSDPMNPELRRDVMRLRATVPRMKMRVCCLEALLQDKQLLAEALAFYRLLAAYLVRLASPASARGLPPSLPLPSPRAHGVCAAAAAVDHLRMVHSLLASLQGDRHLPVFGNPLLQEYYVEDLCELVIWVGRVRPDLIEPRKMEELMAFFTVFLGPRITSRTPTSGAPYCTGEIGCMPGAGGGRWRCQLALGKMVEALHSYMPAPEEGAGAASWRRGRNGRGRSSAAEVAMLFEVHPLVIKNMVRSLITIYIDIEFTDRHNVFNEKFGTRYQIGDVLAYLWNLPQHRASWQAVAREQPKLYVRFINMLINDSQHLLQEALETLPRVQESERLMANPAAFAALTAEEQADAQSGLATNERILRADFQLASVCIKTMQYTSEDRIVAALFFEAEVRDRMARNLDFFLKYLTVPEERKRLRVRDPEKYSWHPKELISQLARIHLNLYRTNPGQWAEAVVADENYYGTTPQMFPELLGVLRTLGLADAQDVADLERMVAQVEQASHGGLVMGTKAATAAEEEAFGEIPDEFEDPLLGGIMRDPVKLPSGNIVDRRTIVQQLLNDPRDPFNRQPMSEVDLVPQPELAQRIRDWVAQQRAASQMQE
ncbi:hypothetical protein N2152v2_009744 [Parachlorella kessleri]